MCNRKNKKINVMLTEETFNQLQAMADKESISISAFVRRLILDIVEVAPGD